MELTSPVIITPRLLVGLHIGQSFLSIDYAGSEDGRQKYIIHIDTPDWEYSTDDLRSGVGGGNLQEGLASTLAFLSSAGEAYRYSLQLKTPNDDEQIFPPNVCKWAYQNSDELSMLEYELEETAGLIQE
jgi:hypothetical protein